MSAITLAILTAFIWGIVPILEKLGLKEIPPLLGLFFRCLGVVVGLFVLGGFLWQESTMKSVNSALGRSSQVPIFFGYAINIRQIFLLLVSGLLAGVVGQIFFYLSLQKGEVSRIVPIAGSYPLISFLLGIVLLGESLSLVKIVAIIFITLGIWLLRF
ncbi:MAG: EamA family transporter [Candidatus Omnitrophica bacterium]|nr:EamA family transporter [Candidatus Omnitrophota bacterium]